MPAPDVGLDMHSPVGTASFRLLRQVVLMRMSKTMMLVAPTGIAGRLGNRARRTNGGQQPIMHMRAGRPACAFLAA
jgi:hypothetical protein